MESKKILIISLVVLFISALGLVGVMVKMIHENSQCLDHPFEYSAQKLEESGGFYDCHCDSLDPSLLDFRFDKEGIYIEDPNQPFSYFDSNFSAIAG